MPLTTEGVITEVTRICIASGMTETEAKKFAAEVEEWGDGRWEDGYFDGQDRE